MAKLTVLAAVLAVLVAQAQAQASTYRTVVTTIIDGNRPITTRQDCREQIQRQDLSNCEQYLSGGMSSRKSSVLSLRRVLNDQLDQCCEQLQEMDMECQCQAMKQMMRELGEGEMGMEEMTEIIRRAGEMTSRCGVEMQCGMGARPLRTNSKSCREQMEEQDMRPCEEYLREGNKALPGTGNRLRQCCQAMDRMDERCQCQALREIVERQREEMGSEQEKQQMMERARELPEQCGMRTRCDMHGRRA